MSVIRQRPLMDAHIEDIDVGACLVYCLLHHKANNLQIDNSCSGNIRTSNQSQSAQHSPSLLPCVFTNRLAIQGLSYRPRWDDVVGEGGAMLFMERTHESDCLRQGAFGKGMLLDIGRFAWGASDLGVEILTVTPDGDGPRWTAGG